MSRVGSVVAPRNPVVVVVFSTGCCWTSSLLAKSIVGFVLTAAGTVFLKSSLLLNGRCCSVRQLAGVRLRNGDEKEVREEREYVCSVSGGKKGEQVVAGMKERRREKCAE